MITKSNDQSKKEPSLQYLWFLRVNKIYKLLLLNAVVMAKTTNSIKCKIYQRSPSLTGIKGEHGVWQTYRLANQQHHRQNINILLKIYRAILDKSRYTSLKLAVRTDAFIVYPIANFCTDNPVKVGSSDNNQEQCHTFWQCQTPSWLLGE